MDQITLYPITPLDRAWVQQTLESRWGSCQIVSRGKLYQGDQLPGYIARFQDRPAGLVTYHLSANQCEITSLDSLFEGVGIGTFLILSVLRVAQAAACRRVWLITTNDNTPAIRFYQKRGFHLVAVYPKAVQFSRTLKPSIPETGMDDIPIRDELEFEILLESAYASDEDRQNHNL